MPSSNSPKAIPKQPLASQRPLFRLGFGAFSCQSVVKALKKRLVQTVIKEIGFSGHSFHKRAALYAADQDMLDESI